MAICQQSFPRMGGKRTAKLATQTNKHPCILPPAIVSDIYRKLPKYTFTASCILPAYYGTFDEKPVRPYR